MAAPLTIQSLSKLGNNVFIKDAVRELTTAIMSAVAEANDSGRQQVEYELPVSFTVGGISKADAQLLIWTDTITAITDPVSKGGRGFSNVKLRKESGEKVYLVVSWESGMAQEERQRRLKLLQDMMCAPSLKRDAPSVARQPARRDDLLMAATGVQPMPSRRSFIGHNNPVRVPAHTTAHAPSPRITPRITRHIESAAGPFDDPFLGGCEEPVRPETTWSTHTVQTAQMSPLTQWYQQSTRVGAASDTPLSRGDPGGSHHQPS